MDKPSPLRLSSGDGDLSSFRNTYQACPGQRETTQSNSGSRRVAEAYQILDNRCASRTLRIELCDGSVPFRYSGAACHFARSGDGEVFDWYRTQAPNTTPREYSYR